MIVLISYADSATVEYEEELIFSDDGKLDFPNSHKHYFILFQPCTE
jgi:hypothetical protein